MSDRPAWPVVFDVNVLVGAVIGGNSPFRSWPSPPPVSDNPSADCLGIANDAREVSLWLSEHLLAATARVLIEGAGWDLHKAEEYVELLVEIAGASGGGVAEPRETIADCPDFEHNRILELAAEVQADMIVSDDADLTAMSPWRGVPILRPRDFAARVDARRRARGRRGR